MYTSSQKYVYIKSGIHVWSKVSATSKAMPHVIRRCQKIPVQHLSVISAHDGHHRRGVQHASCRVRGLYPWLLLPGLALGLRPNTRKQRDGPGVSRSSCGKSQIVGKNPK